MVFAWAPPIHRHSRRGEGARGRRGGVGSTWDAYLTTARAGGKAERRSYNGRARGGAAMSSNRFLVLFLATGAGGCPSSRRVLPPDTDADADTDSDTLE